ncbi:MAG: hypothetical protein HKM04_08605 [Legionellales bacterium]|nr:hypothetical protein [Legionellales bacterium]
MFILGLMSLLQILFLPGYLFLGFYQFKRGILQTLILSFGLSVSFNYWIVLILTTLHIYNHTVVLCLFVVEFFLLLWQRRHFFHHPLLTEQGGLWEHLKAICLPLFLLIKQAIKHFNLAKSIALFSVVYFIYCCFYREPISPFIFSSWDAVVSWNRWALDWYQDIFPKLAYEYPQLLPINISLAYQIIGSSIVQYFAKCLSFIFPLAMMGALWDIGSRQANKGYYWAVFFLSAILLIILGNLSVSGDADVPAASMSLVGFYALLLSDTYQTESEAKKSIFIAAILFAGAAVTKQSGAIFIPLFPFMLYFFLSDALIGQQKRRLSLICLAMMLLYALPWYIYKFIQIYYGYDVDVVKYLLQGGGYLSLPTTSSGIEKARYGMQILFQTLYYGQTHFPLVRDCALAIMTFLLFWGCWFDRFVRKIVFIMVLPGFLIWLCFVSYDLRNIAVALPFLAIALGVSFEKGLSYLKSLWFRKNPRFWRLGVLAVLLTFGVVLSNSVFSTDRLINGQLRRQEQIGDPSVNQVLYRYFENHPLNGLIMSNYMILPYLPKFDKQHYVLSSLNDVPRLIEALNINHPAYLLILKNESVSPACTIPVETYVLSNQKQFEIITQNDSILFCKVK